MIHSSKLKRSSSFLLLHLLSSLFQKQCLWFRHAPWKYFYIEVKIKFFAVTSSRIATVLELAISGVVEASSIIHSIFKSPTVGNGIAHNCTLFGTFVLVQFNVVTKNTSHGIVMVSLYNIFNGIFDRDFNWIFSRYFSGILGQDFEAVAGGGGGRVDSEDGGDTSTGMPHPITSTMNIKISIWAASGTFSGGGVR